MDARSLAAIVEDLAKLDLERMDADAIFGRLADLLRTHGRAARVALYGAWIEAGQSQPAADATVIGGASPPDAISRPLGPAGGLTLLGRSAVLGDLRELTCEIISGPVEGQKDPLSADERCLVIRVRLSRVLCWALIYGGRELEDDRRIGDWTAAVAALLRWLAHGADPFDLSTVRGLRKQFYQSLLDYIPRRPQEDFRRLCEAWQRVSGADWTWLWLYNSISDRYELTAVASRDAEPAARLRALPAMWTAPGRPGVGHFCSLSRNAVVIDDLAGWRGTHEGHGYRVVLAEDLRSLGCTALTCVPLFGPQTDEATGESRATNVITLHYLPATQRIRHAETALLNMGRLTALVIQNAQVNEQREILVSLNDMAQRYLTRASRRPADVRNEYMTELIALIQDRLNVRGVSIFYRSRFEDAIECIATTGLQDPQDEPVAASDLAKVVYSAGEGLTGKCYATVAPLIAERADEASGYVGKFHEARQTEAESDIDPVLLYPIPPPPDDPGPTRRALGVIRCVQHKSALFPGRLRSFDPTEVETLGFIAQQIGPVLQTFAQRIERERAISVAKHDLAAPLGMVRDTIANVIRAQEKSEPFGEHDLRDIEVSNSLAMNLIEQLDPDPGSVRVFDPQPTYLEGDIVARLRDMLSHYAWRVKRMRIHFDGFRQVPQLFIDRALVERAIYNLLLNAIKYGEKETTIDIDARLAGANFVVSISNFGLGVEAEEEAHLFRPYYRSPRAERQAKMGLGLGLAIAKQAMKANGGDLRLTARKDPTVFSLIFPTRLAVAGRK